MNKVEYTKMFALEDKHFWFLAKRNFVDSVLFKYKRQISHILDLGSGTGGMTKHLEKYGKVLGIENYDYAIKLARGRKLDIQKGDLNKFVTPNNHFDLVTIFDVLYHQNIKDESIILKRVHKTLNKNGFLLITDSALDMLTSEHDVVTQGKRRYSLSQIKKLVEGQNFKVIKASYIYFSLFPFIFFKRVVLDRILGESTSDVKPAPNIINKILISILKFESLALKYCSFPIGSSVILLAVKK